MFSGFEYLGVLTDQEEAVAKKFQVSTEPTRISPFGFY